MSRHTFLVCWRDEVT